MFSRVLDEKETKSVSTQTDVPVVEAVQPEPVVEKTEEPATMTQPDTGENSDSLSALHLPVQPYNPANSTNGDASSFCEIVDGSVGHHTTGDSMTNDHSAAAENNSGSGAGKRLLIGKNVEKIPNLSVSTLERELVSIINDATSTMKSVEEDEAAVKEQEASNFVQQTEQQPAQYQFYEYADTTKAPAVETNTVEAQNCLSSAQQPCPAQNEIVFVTMDSACNQVAQSKDAFVTANPQRSNQPVYCLVTGPPGLQPADATRLLQQHHQQQQKQQQQAQSLVIMPQIATSSPLVNRAPAPKVFATGDLKINLINALNDAPKIKLGKLTHQKTKPQLTVTTSRSATSASAPMTNPILNGIINGSIENKAGTKRSKSTALASGQVTKKPCPDRTPSVKAIYDHVSKGGIYEPKKRGRKSKKFLQEAEAAAALALGQPAPVLTNATNMALSQAPSQPVQVAQAQTSANVDILGLFNAIDPKQSQTEMQNDDLSELMNLINETQAQPTSTSFDSSAILNASGRMLRSRSKL